MVIFRFVFFFPCNKFLDSLSFRYYDRFWFGCFTYKFEGRRNAWVGVVEIGLLDIQNICHDDFFGNIAVCSLVFCSVLNGFFFLCSVSRCKGLVSPLSMTAHCATFHIVTFLVPFFSFALNRLTFADFFQVHICLRKFGSVVWKKIC